MQLQPKLIPALMAGILSLAAFTTLPAWAEPIHPEAIVTHGVAAGDVTSHSAVIWSRANQASTMYVQILDEDEDEHAKQQNVRVTADHDFTGKVQVNGLKPDTDYRYRVWFGSNKGHHHNKNNVEEGRFHTAPRSDAVKAVTFSWIGDLAGQNTCRDSVEGFPIFNAINATKQDFVIGLGDMIYADGTCEATGRYGNKQIIGNFTQSADMENYWAHWKYNREDSSHQALLARTPFYAIWDDHEVVNDFGPLHDTRDTAPYTSGDKLLPKGLAAFMDYNPVTVNSDTPKRLYRNVRWGKHLELFILDTRQYRDANFASDAATEPKTMLGREEVVWLKEQLKKSDATWKVIVSSVPMSIPTGSSGDRGRDGWANYLQAGGFEYELVDLLRYMQKNEMKNVAFLTTDVHFAEAFRYTPFSDDPSFQVYEFVSGPINAGVFPNRAFDDTLNPEQLFFFGAENRNDVTTWEQAKSWFNYGAMKIDENGRMTASINGIDGNNLYEISVDPR
jgi:alkaline phosphatase D